MAATGEKPMAVDRVALPVIERWFAALTTEKLRRGAHRSVR